MTASWVALGAGTLGLLVLAAAGPAYRYLGVPLDAAFATMRVAAYIGAGTAVGGAAIAAYQYVRSSRLAIAVTLLGVVMGLVALGVPYTWDQRLRTLPPIHDISTDLENPPAFEAVVPLRAGAPNALVRTPAVTGQQRRGYPDIAPITLPSAMPVTFDKALALAQASGWTIVTADKGAGRIEATATTRWFGFEDDVVLRLTPWGAGTRVDMRSVSRVRTRDAGTNAGRIRAFLAGLQRG
jgi:uncharacterized protein (DUF1499 family)